MRADERCDSPSPRGWRQGSDREIDKDWVPDPASNLVPIGDVRSRESRSDEVCDEVGGEVCAEDLWGNLSSSGVGA